MAAQEDKEAMLARIRAQLAETRARLQQHQEAKRNRGRTVRSPMADVVAKQRTAVLASSSANASTPANEIDAPTAANPPLTTSKSSDNTVTTNDSPPVSGETQASSEATPRQSAVVSPGVMQAHVVGEGLSNLESSTSEANGEENGEERTEQQLDQRQISSKPPSKFVGKEVSHQNETASATFASSAIPSSNITATAAAEDRCVLSSVSQSNSVFPTAPSSSPSTPSSLVATSSGAPLPSSSSSSSSSATGASSSTAEANSTASITEAISETTKALSSTSAGTTLAIPTSNSSSTSSIDTTTTAAAAATTTTTTTASSSTSENEQSSQQNRRFTRAKPSMKPGERSSAYDLLRNFSCNMGMRGSSEALPLARIRSLGPGVGSTDKSSAQAQPTRASQIVGTKRIRNIEDLQKAVKAADRQKKVICFYSL